MVLDAAVHEYLHLITRTRPWMQPREQEVLTAFCDWLQRQPVRATLENVSPIFATTYAKAQHLSPDEHDELLMVLHNLCLWAYQNGLIVSNPFSLVRLVSCAR